MISDTYKTVFIHNPKCAGTSIKSALMANPDGHWKYGDWHYTITQLKKIPLTHNDYHKFAVVRNPYDRFVSAFTYNIEKVCVPEDYHWVSYPLSYKVLSSYIIRGDRWSNRLSGSDLISSFRAFVKSPDFAHIHDKGWPVHMKPQSHFFKYEDLDTVCFFEDLMGPDCGIPRVEEKTGLVMTMPYTNMSAHPDYWEFYDVECMDLVKKMYFQDFKEFGYNIYELGVTR